MVRRLLLLIPFAIVVCIWLVSLFHVVFYVKAIHTQIGLIDGTLIWIGPNPYNFKYPLIRALIGSLVLVMAVKLFRWFCSNVGILVFGAVGTVAAIVWSDGALGCPVGIFDLLLLQAWDQQRSRGAKAINVSICQTCGYDLRATPERCPECGTKVWRP